MYYKCIVNNFTQNTRPLATVQEDIQKLRFMPINCSRDYEKERKLYPGTENEFSC